MARQNNSFVCQQCGASHGKWTGKCDNCGVWNSIIEQPALINKLRGISKKEINKIEFLSLVGKEISEQLLKENITPDIYLCCCGGGGLIAGSSLYLKEKFKNIENYSVEPENFNDTQVSLQNNKIAPI